MEALLNRIENEEKRESIFNILLSNGITNVGDLKTMVTGLTRSDMVNFFKQDLGFNAVEANLLSGVITLGNLLKYVIYYSTIISHHHLSHLFIF